MEFVEKKRINEKKLKEMKKIGLIFENSNRKLLIKNKMEKNYYLIVTKRISI